MVSVPSGDHALHRSLKSKFHVRYNIIQETWKSTLKCGCFHSFVTWTFPPSHSLTPALIHVPSSGIVERASSFLKRGSNRYLLSHALCVWPLEVRLFFRWARVKLCAQFLCDVHGSVVVVVFTGGPFHRSLVQDSFYTSL